MDFDKFRWSFSQWENYDGCPARWKFKSILKLPSSPPGPAAARGLEMHDRVEKYITGHRDDLSPPDMMFGDRKPAVISPCYIPIIDAYRDHPNGDRHCEKRISFDHDWSINGTRAKEGGCMTIPDAVRVEKGLVRIGEWKSGKPKDRHKDQRSLYALAGLISYFMPTDGRVEVTTYYLELPNESPKRLKVTGEDLPKLMDKWTSRAKDMARNQICAPRPGPHCNWCDYARRKGGPCQFGR